MLTPDRTALEANLSFYEAFAAQDIDGMEQIWAARVDVVCIHAGWQVLYGRDDVVASWRAIFAAGDTAVRCDRARPLVLHDVAIVTCIERLQQRQLAATNVFVLDRGLWRMIHHQSAPFSARAMPLHDLPPRGALN